MKTISRFDWIEGELAGLKAKNLYRRLRVLENIKGTRATIEGREVSLFSGNDYLGLSQHPKIVEAAERVLKTHGLGTGSARLISGTSKWHVALEEQIARFLGKERALIFSSGYLANLGALSALAKPDDLVVLDKLCHASLIDAARLSGCEMRVYPHKNLAYLENILTNWRRASFPQALSGNPRLRRSGTGLDPRLKHSGMTAIGESSRAWIVTDSIFSMDGDLAPLPELVELKNRYGAYLVIDEAHATGVFGASGRGVTEHFGVSDEIDVHIGTLSKAIGAFGGFVTGRSELIKYLINRARPFIFETALPASICAAAACALDLIGREPELRERLWQNVKRLRNGLKEIGAPILDGESPIIPVVLGDEKRTLEASEFLLEKGFLIPAVRYPTVAKGKARLRVTVSSAHSESEIARLITAFKDVPS